MKQKNSFGNFQIVAQHSRGVRKKYDAFYSHGSGWTFVTKVLGSPGPVVLFTQWTLKNGQPYFYEEGTFADNIALNDFILLCIGTETPHWPPTYTGEWYNKIIRGQTKTKLTLAQYLVWTP